MSPTLRHILRTDAPLVDALPTLLRTLPQPEPAEATSRPETLTWENYLDGVPSLPSFLIKASGINDDVAEDLASAEPAISAEEETVLTREVARRAMLIRLRKLQVIRGG